MISIKSEANNAAYFKKHFLVPGCGTEAPPVPHFTGEEIVGLSSGYVMCVYQVHLSYLLMTVRAVLAHIFGT